MSAFQQLLLGVRRAGSSERLAAATAAAVVLVAAVVVIVPGESRSRQRGLAEGIGGEQTTGSTAQGLTADGLTAEGGVGGATGAGGASGSAEVTSGGPGSATDQGGPSPRGTMGPGSATDQGGPRGSIAMGPGVTATTIKVGVHLTDPASSRAVYLALGGRGGTTAGDNLAAAQAIVKYLNAHGGIAGRKVLPVYDQFDGTQPNTAEFQRACATFTQDNRVFAVASHVRGFQGVEILAGCLAKAKTVYVNSKLGITDKVVIDRFAPYMYGPPYLAGHRWGTIIDQLVGGKYFDKGAKLGVIWTDDEPTRRSYKGPGLRRLAAHGLKVTADATISPTNSGADYGTASRETNQAVLRFRDAGVTHVLFFNSAGWGPFFFLPAAESQGYRPRYAMTSLENIVGQVPQSPAAQFHRSVAVSWWPTEDVDWPQDPKDNPAQDQCAKIIREAGVDMSGRRAFAGFAALCDAFFFLKTALGQAEALTPAGFRSAVDRFGTSYRSPLTYSTRFGPGRFDGVNATRLQVFDDGCGCFKYSGKWKAAP